MKKLLNIATLMSCLLFAGGAYPTEAPTLKDIAEKENNAGKLDEIAAERTTGPYDEFKRITPKSSIASLAIAIRDGDYKRAVNYLDLRNLPFSLNKDLDGEDLVKKLAIIAKRSMTIDIDDLSDKPAGHLDDGLPVYRDRIATVKTKKGPVDILMQRVPDKNGVQVWKISNKTVAQVPALDKELGYGVIGGKLSLIFPHYVIFGLEIWQLTLLLILVTLGYMVSVVVTFVIIKLLLTRKNFKAERLKKFIVGPLRFLITVIFIRATFDLIAPTLVVKAIYDAKTFLIAAILWILLGLVGLIMNRMADRMELNGQHDAVVLLRPATTGIKVVLILFALMSWVDNLGYQVTTILAGLGVGGIAVALAAQKSLENLIGAITIYSSRPVRVGEVCKFDNIVGVVEEIGLRATKLRTLARTVVHIPNAAFAAGTIENLTERDKMLYQTRLRLSLNESPDKVKQVLLRLREMISDQDYIDDENSRVRFLDFGEYAQELELYVYIKTPVFAEYLERREEINLSINDIIASAGVQLVVPTKKTYINQTEITRSA